MEDNWLGSAGTMTLVTFFGVHNATRAASLVVICFSNEVRSQRAEQFKNAQNLVVNFSTRICCVIQPFQSLQAPTDDCWQACSITCSSRGHVDMRARSTTWSIPPIQMCRVGVWVWRVCGFGGKFRLEKPYGGNRILETMRSTAKRECEQ